MDNTLKVKIDTWITQNYKWFLGEIKTNICKGRMRDYADDLAIHMIETLYTQHEDKLNQMLDDDMLGWWLLTGAGRQLRSSTSPFYRIYRKEKSWAREEGVEGSHLNIFERPWEEYNDDLYQCFRKEYDSLHFYQRALMDKYFMEGWTFQQIYEYYNISKTHLMKDINTTINQIRTKCQHC